VTAPEPIVSSRAATEDAWQSRVQWSTLLVPKPARTSFWKRYASSFEAFAEPKPASACEPSRSRILLSPAAARSSASSHVAVRELGAHVRLVDEGCGHERAGRAGLHALATGDAGRFPHRIVEIEYDLFAITAAGHADHVVDLHLAASADAEIALNAGVEIDRHRRVAAVGNRRGVAGKPAHDDILPLRGLPEFRLRIARHVLGRLIGKQQLQHHATRRLCAIGLRLDLHAGRRRTDAACCEHALAFDLHHADATVAVGAVAGLGQVAQVGQLDSEAARGAEDRLASADLNLAPVDAEGVGLAARVSAHRITICPSPASFETWVTPAPQG